jgi:hypothetical protein
MSHLWRRTQRPIAPSKLLTRRQRTQHNANTSVTGQMTRSIESNTHLRCTRTNRWTVANYRVAKKGTARIFRQKMLHLLLFAGGNSPVRCWNRFSTNAPHSDVLTGPDSSFSNSYLHLFERALIKTCLVFTCASCK